MSDVPAQAERVVSVEHDPFISFLRIRPPLDTLEQLQGICKIAYEPNYDVVPEPSQRDFERSRMGDMTQIYLHKKTKDEVMTIGQRVTDLLRENYQLAARFDTSV